MKRPVLFGLSFLLCAGTALAQSAPPDTSLQARFDGALNTPDETAWLKQMSSEPNNVGSPHDKLNAEFELAQFKKWGWDARIETFQVLYPTPIAEAVEMGSFKATLTEKPIPGNSSSTFKDPALPAYLEYQGDGDVNAPLVYVNYGSEADYKQLEQMGISVKGKIVIARYGETWRGVKPLLAYQHGAIGCLIYSDPIDDGYAQGEVYPKGPMRPPQGIQRGSAMDMMLYPGDPLTPGTGATGDATRLTKETAQSIMKIPALPISYGDAQVLLAAMAGPTAPGNWRGALPITYHVGGTADAPSVHLMVKSNWDLKPAYDVIAMLKGSKYPDQWIIRGNHRDGWVAGASDPLSGQVSEMDEARSMGLLLKSGWRPKRTIVYTSWDGEEPMLLGSTEWVESHFPELKQKGFLYINTDGTSRGYLNAGGVQDLSKFITAAANTVIDPEAHITLAQRARDRAQVQALARNASAEQKAEAKRLSDPNNSLTVSSLGSGSDFSPFVDHLGMATMTIGFGGEAPGGGVYHSLYDTFEHHMAWDDPGLVYSKVLAEMVGHIVLAAADSDLPIQHPEEFASTANSLVSAVERLADNQRSTAEAQSKALSDKAFAMVADPLTQHADPTPLKAVPKFDFSALDSANAKLKQSAAAYEAAVKAKGASATPAQIAKLQSLMQNIDQTMLSEEGLPGRPWFKNMIFAPGRYIGYGVTTLPGISEAISEERFDEVPKYIKVTADALNAYAARLDAATAVLGTPSS